MPYSGPSGMQRGISLSLKSSAAETASTTGPAVRVGELPTMVVTAAVSAASGTTPTMTLVIEGSADGSNWAELGTIGSNGYRSGSVGTAPADFSGAGTVRAAFVAPEFVRYRSVIAGTTPSFTYSVNAEIS